MKMFKNGLVMFAVIFAAQFSLANNANWLDVRTPQEYISGHVDGAENIDFLAADFKQKVESLDRNATYKVYCRSGNRSQKAIAVMRGMGFKSLEDHGAFDALKDKEKSCTGVKPKC